MELTAQRWIDRQLPAAGEIFLDHIGYFVRDLDAAGARLARLGFRVSPINLQQNVDETGTLRPSGTSNRLAVLRRGFIELVAATHDTPLADALTGALERCQGIHLIALSRADIAAERARLTAAGFAMQPVVQLRRHKQTADGMREVRWSVLRPEAGVMPEGRVQFAFCHTPELTWDDGVPENAADGLSDLLLRVADRHEAAGRYGRYLDRAAIHGGDASLVPLDRGRLVFVEPKGAAEILPGLTLPALPFMAGQALRSADIAATRAILERNGVAPLFANASLVCVGPADALGGHLLFHAPTITDPWAALAERQ